MLLLLGLVLVWLPHIHAAGTVGARATYYPNTVFSAESTTIAVTNSALGYDVFPPLSGTDWTWDYFSVRWSGSFVPPYNGTYHFSCVSADDNSVYFWIDDHVFCPNSNYTLTQLPLIAGHPYDLRAEYHHSNPSETSAVGFRMIWNATQPGIANQTDPIPITTKFIRNETSNPDVSVHHDALRERLHNYGWGTHLNFDMLSHAYLPDGFNLQLGLYDTVTQDVMQGIYPKTIGVNPNLLPGLHSWSGSRYSEATVMFNNITVTVTSTVTGKTTHGDLQLLVTPNIITSRYLLLLIPSYQWTTYGFINMSSSSLPYIVSSGFGMKRTFEVYATQNPVTSSIPGGKVNGEYLAFPLNQELAITTGSGYSVDTVRAAIDTALAAELAPLEPFKKYGTDIYDSFVAMQSVLSWMALYTPYEGIFMPVTRSWDFNFGYVLFDWDSYFASYMAAYQHHPTARDVAYNTVIQTTRARSTLPDGTSFVPNFTSGPRKSNDRSEPQVGSKVVWELYQWYKDEWFIRLQYPTLLSWNDWTWKHRRVMPYGLVVLGSDIPDTPGDTWSGFNVLQSAKYESGLDNSPMYDEATFDSNVTHKMNLYEVGMTSMYAMDCLSLIEIAKVLGFDDDVKTLQSRYDSIADATQKYFWNSTNTVYQNRFTDTDQFSYHVSPTNFYPMLAGIPDLTQVHGMNLRWLSNASEMCMTGTCEGAGMPSITRTDPAFNDNTYWRGRIWGPELLLMYWCLSHPSYKSDALITSTRTTMLAQSRAMLLKEWREYGHVHENYNGNTGIGCDVTNSDPYYTWGALSGFISILEYVGTSPLNPVAPSIPETITKPRMSAD